MLTHTHTHFTRAVPLAYMSIEMDASVQQQMPWRRFEKETEKTILSLNVKDIFCTS